jgi:hypothetical protein
MIAAGERALYDQIGCQGIGDYNTAENVVTQVFRAMLCAADPAPTGRRAADAPH